MTKIMKKKNTNGFYRKSVQLLAAAAVSAALLGTQAPYVFAGNDTAVETSSLIPENVTIEEPVALSEIALPGNEYGTLSWADESFVPTKRVQSCEVIFKPAGSVDLSNVSGWDAESGVLTGYITVVVSSLSEEAPSEAPAEDESENEEPEITVTPEVTVTVTPGADGEKDATGVPDGGTVTPTLTPGETPSGEEIKEPENTPAGDGEQDLPAAGQIGADEALDMDGGQEGEDEGSAPEKVENIFDRPQTEPQEDTRPATVEENLTEEEKAARAALNHSCEGITVSGISLPWYVQFRVSNGDSYQFTNQTEAAIFQSYEFELWDLQNNTEYEIPDGEYISVTVPVKEGYEYTIEHLLDNGATETIIPSVEGDMMIFSTHSFSPFGIAGSKPLVGADIAEDGYQEPGEQLGQGETSSAAQTGQTALTATPGAAAQDKNTTGGSEITDNSKAKSTDSDTEQKGTSSKAVNTGDNTTIYPFIILVVAAVIIIGAVVFVKKRK